MKRLESTSSTSDSARLKAVKKVVVIVHVSSSSLNFGHALEVSQQTDLDRLVGSETRSVDCPYSCLSE